MSSKTEEQSAKTDERYPYTHHGSTVHGSKLADYLVSVFALREDYPEMFKDGKEDG